MGPDYYGYGTRNGSVLSYDSIRDILRPREFAHRVNCKVFILPFNTRKSVLGEVYEQLNHCKEPQKKKEVQLYRRCTFPSIYLSIDIYFFFSCHSFC